MSTPSARERVRISLLGGFGVRVGPYAVDDAAWRLRRARSVVKLLALAPGHRLHREQVITALWPDQAPEPALNNLHQAMHSARRALSLALAAGAERGQVRNEARHERPGLLYIHDHIVRLEPPLPLWVDVEAFEAAAARASGTADIGTHEAAVGLYEGELLPDDRYEEWTVERREALARRYVALLSDLAALLERAGQFPRAAEHLRRVLAADPTHEEAHTGLMRLFALMGQRQEALRQFHDLQTALKEIDADPQPASVDLHQAILAGDLARLAGAASRPLAGPAPPSRRPAQAAPAVRRKHTGNLPVPLTTLVGRERDLTALKALLEGHRMLTLTGPGGVGKTRLGLELASVVRERFPDGVWWVDLQALTDSTQVAQTVAAMLGVREQPGQSLETALGDWLGDRFTLIVFDNCEHVLGGSATVAERLLRACPNLRFLTTSREPLALPGESRWPVPPLTLAPRHSQLPPEELRAFEALRLFEIRSRAVHPAFALTAGNAAAVAEICRRLDGLPLAIELAAARTHVLSAAQILDHLTDRLALLTMPGRGAPRYSTLAGAIDWSYQLLSESERALFRRLAVFAGGFTLEAAQPICAGAPVDAERVLDLLAGLVDKSLVMVEEQPDGTVRYRLLETIWEYAQEKLTATTDQAEIRDRHLSWYLELVASLEEPVAIIDVEHENIRAAVEWSQREGDADKGLRLADCMHGFWMSRGRLSEGRDWLTALLQHCGGASLVARAKARRTLGRLIWQLGDSAAAAPLLEEALTDFRALGDKSEIATSIWFLGTLARNQGEYSRALALYKESQALFRELGAMPSALLGSVALVQLALGDCDAAEASGSECLAIAHQTGQAYWLAESSGLVGELHLNLGKCASARALFEECVDVATRHNFPVHVAHGLTGLGFVAKTEGKLSRGQSLFEEALRLCRESGFKRGTSLALNGLADVARMERRLDEADSLAKSALRGWRAQGAKHSIARCLLQLAKVECDREQLRRSARLCGAAEALRDALGVVLYPDIRPEYEDYVSRLRTHLGEGAFAQAWAEGRSMTMDEAVAYALGGARETEQAPVGWAPHSA